MNRVTPGTATAIMKPKNPPYLTEKAMKYESIPAFFIFDTKDFLSAAKRFKIKALVGSCDENAQ